MEIKGFSFSAVEAGIRYSNRLDLGLIHSEVPCAIAGVFTTSLVKAAPVVIDQRRLEKGVAQTILVNSGCANACTGAAGMDAALRTSALASEKLGIRDDLVMLSSTGVIGEQLNVRAFENNVDFLVANLSSSNFVQVAKAIMTTDTVHKTSEATITVNGSEIKIMGMAKGAGMIMPNMATMLAFVFTDANIPQHVLQEILLSANEKTFNRITVDGDTSTNDMVLLMANGSAGNKEINNSTPAERKTFCEAVEAVLKDLALQIVGDGEGANKTIIIKVRGASSDEDAEKIGRTIATSSLVKTAFFGEDANWGRILGAMGRAGVQFAPDTVDLYFGDVMLVGNGLGLDKHAEEAATRVLKEKEFTIRVEMKLGNGAAELYTCDFSIDYVKINADYRS